MATRKRVFCDTNILLDIFDHGRRDHEHAIALLWYAMENAGSVQLVSSITSFKDAYYIMERLYRDEAAARASIAGIMGDIIAPVDMLASYGQEAIASAEPDFEDALIGACAEHEGAFVLVTGDRKAFDACPVPHMTAKAFLEQEGFDYALVDL